ncbi:MAG: ADP-ribosylglycohydrolase family protein [Actinomycetota bacterium]
MADASRITGLLVGAAVGDALGAPFEFKPAGSYANRFPQPVLGGIGELIGGGGFNWEPGEFTDDTQMAMVLAESLLSNGLRLNPDLLFASWREWASEAKDIGNTTRHALSFERWQDVRHHNPERTAANGALMRAFPLALLEVDHITRREWTLQQAALTHAHPDAGFGAWLGVAMMRAALEGRNPFERLNAELEKLPAESRDRFAPLLAETWEPSALEGGNGSVWGCLACAVWAVRGAKSFEDAVVRAVNVGDDADTVACVAGALAGAKFTEQEIPSRWWVYVHGTANSNTYRLEDLEMLARRLAGRGVNPPRREAPRGPREVFPNLYASNRSAAENVPTDWAIMSFCRTEGCFVNHPVRRQSYLLDDEVGNLRLEQVVTDAVATMDALLAEGHKVVVHCEGGRSRTCLVLKAWWMKTSGGSHDEATAWLHEQWPYCSDHNRSFAKFLAGARPSNTR